MLVQTVSNSTQGNNLFEANKELFNRREATIVEEIGRQVRFFK